MSMFAFEFEWDQQFYVFLFPTMVEKTTCDLMSHKGQKVHNYPVKFKITATEYAEIHGNKVATRKFVLNEKEYENGGAQWRRVSGDCRKFFREKLE